MIRIYPEQLTFQLKKKLRTCYLIFGNDPFLSQEIVHKICQVAQEQRFIECYTYSIDTSTDWNGIYLLSQSLSLFSDRQILILTLPDKSFTTIIAEQLLKLSKLLHPDLLLILRGTQLTKTQENSAWCKKIGQNGVYVNCLTPTKSRLPTWITQQAKAMSMTLDKKANQLLCYYYEGNLLAINQILKRLSILYSDTNLTLNHVKEEVNHAVNFTPYHWVDALLTGDIKRAWCILQKLQRENYEIVTVLRIIQSDLIFLLILKQHKNDKNFKKLFDKHKVWISRYMLINTAIQRLSLHTMKLAIQLIAQAELHLKQNYSYSAWQKLEILSMLLCGKSLPEIFLYD